MATTLGQKAAGSIIKIKENGVAVDFYVCKHDYESGLNGAGLTLIVRKDVHSTMAWEADNVNAFSGSDIDNWMNGTYLNSLDPDIRAVIPSTKIYYTPGNGNTTVTTISRKIFPLSATELGHTHSYLKTEGTALSIAGTLKIAYLNGAATTQWTRSPHTGRANGVWYLGTDGSFHYVNAISTRGARPALTLPSSLSVSDGGDVTVNTPPTISSGTASGTDLGIIATEGFDFSYSVSDEDGDPVTVKEYLDNVLKRTYTATLGASNTFECVTAANWQTVLNGQHTLKVVANDGKADSAPYTVTFTKKVTTATITLETPLDADDLIAAMVLTLVAELPEDVEMEVLVTNNAKDAAPVWEDATADVKNKFNHVFTNQTATEGFAFNFKLTFSRGGSDQGGFVSNIGGAFE